MKNILKNILFMCIVIGVCVTMLASCGNGHAHKWGLWEQIKAPTCTENGVEERKCECGSSEKQEIKSTGHKDGEWKKTKVATATENGEDQLFCANCGEVLRTEVGYLRSDKLRYYSVEGGYEVGVDDCTDSEIIVPPFLK